MLDAGDGDCFSGRCTNDRAGIGYNDNGAPLADVACHYSIVRLALMLTQQQPVQPVPVQPVPATGATSAASASS
jgi:hypothetical protein